MKGENYEIYNIKEDNKITFPTTGWVLAGLNGKAEWLEDKIILWGWNGKQKDILDLKNKTVEVVKLEENEKKGEDEKSKY
jgi:hypothetical protein